MTLPSIGDAIDVVLRDGSTVRLRPAQPSDEAAVRAMFSRLSPESLYSRFFRIPKLPALDVSGLLHADPDRAFTLVAESRGEACALAGYTRDPRRPDRAEVAFVTGDALQGRGVGTRMLETLADVARAHHIRQFDAYVLADNDRMMRVFVDSGFAIEQQLDAGVFHVTLDLDRTAEFEARAATRSEAAATASVQAFLAPRSVAVIGASRERGKIGSEILHNLLSAGFTGRLFAVHPQAASIDGVPAFRTVGGIPEDVDLAVICVPARHVSGVVDDCIAKGVRALVIISAGFAETGAAGRALEASIVARIREAGIRLVGPNCMGVLNTAADVRLNATFAPVYPPAGRTAMSTQSGALGLAVLDYARDLGIGLSTFVSVGNKADVSSNDLIQYWANDPNTSVILLYLESFGNPRKFSQIARRVGRRKPIIAVKSGRSAAGARAASSHTGALASSDAIVDALFRQAGVIRTATLEEMFDVARLLAMQPLPAGRRVAILTNAGGPGILAADACEAAGLVLPALSKASVAGLRAFLPAAAAIGNPVDMIASATAGQYERALDVLLEDQQVDSVLVIFIPPLVTKGEDVAAAIKRVAAARPGKPVLAIFMSAQSAGPILEPIPCFSFPESAAVALARATAHGDWRRQPEVAPPAFDDIDGDAARAIVDRLLETGGGWLSPDDGQALLAAVRIPAASSRTASNEDAAVEAAERIGYPIVLKAIGPAILHKTEIGGVRLGLTTAGDVRQAWRDLAGRLGDAMTGGLVQEMVAGGVEMLVGALEDPTFGPVIACGTGGTLAELLADTQFRLHPLNERDARAMIEGLRGAKLLRGYRGAAAADEAALREALLRLSALIEICPEIAELDVNPLTVLAHGVRAIDVRIRVERPKPRPSSRRVSY
ncbi:MAG TPA: GNAT family N-acetyltransferase [Vicinamibacterales bacterium]